MGHTLLGLSRGTNWIEAEQFYKTQHGNNSEEKANRLMMQMAIEQIKKDPSIAFQKGQKNFIQFTFETYTEFTNALGLEKPALRICKTRFLHGHVVFFIFFIGMLFIGLLTFKFQPLLALIFVVSLSCVVGVVPLVYGDAGWRSVAGSYPALALFPVTIFALISGLRDRLRLPLESPVDQTVVGPMVFMSRFLATALLGILLLSIFWPWVQSKIYGQGSSSARVFRAELQPGARQRWTSGNSAIAHPSTVLNELKIHEEMLQEPPHLTHFFEKNQSSIQAIQLYISKDESTWEFVSGEKKMLEQLQFSPSIHPLLPKFRIINE